MEKKNASSVSSDFRMISDKWNVFEYLEIDDDRITLPSQYKRSYEDYQECQRSCRFLLN